VHQSTGAPATSETTYIGSLYELIAESGQQKALQHIFAGSQRIATTTTNLTNQTTSTNYYHGDHLGSSNVVTDETGQQVSLTEFTPLGSTFKQTGSYDPKHKFTGKELDASTNLYFYGARYYDHEIGRFITADPTIQHPYDPQDLNRYAYCRNNPLNLIDPSGLGWWKDLWKGIGDFFSNLGKSIADNPGVFIAGVAGGFAFGVIGATIAKGIGGFLGAASETFLGGAIIGSVEFGIGGFGAGLASGFASGMSAGEAFRNAGYGAVAGAILGVAIEGSYMAGWQDVLHGASREEIIQARLDRIAGLARSGDPQAINLWNELASKHDMLLTRTNSISATKGFGLHPDIFASKTTKEILGAGFDMKSKSDVMKTIFLGKAVPGHFRQAGALLSKNTVMLKLESMNSLIVNKAFPVLKSFIGQERSYIGKGAFLGIGGTSNTYTCQEGARDILKAIFSRD
jgi:RHS repeat-associated protein